jgi:hypothetical protein
MKFIIVVVLLAGLVLTGLLLMKARLEGKDSDDGPGKRS